jgi:hypothetical protein
MPTDLEKLVIDQVNNVFRTAETILGNDHAITLALRQAREASGIVVPAGFSDIDSYNTFLGEQLDAFADPNNDGTMIMENLATATDVVGNLVDEDTGQITLVGNMRTNIQRFEEMIEMDEPEDLPEAATSLTLTYERLGGGDLTQADVELILAHPISASLKHLGNYTVAEILSTADTNRKEAVLLLSGNGDLDVRALQMNVARYRGVHVFPKLGRVSAVARVTQF